MMWFEPLAEMGALLAGCAVVIGATAAFFEQSQKTGLRPISQRATAKGAK